MESVSRTPAMCRRIGQPVDDLQLLDDRPGPSVIYDEGQGVVVAGTNVDEVDIQPIDLGDELRQGVQGRLARAPVVVRRPMARELLDQSERHALGFIRDGLLLGPVRCREPTPKIIDRLLRNIDHEGPDDLVGCGGRLLGRCGGRHLSAS